MTHRDLAWRSFGAALFLMGGVIGLNDRVGSSSFPGLAGFLVAVFGFVLIVQGKRVPAALRIERSRHKSLPHSIHARRRRRPENHNG